MLCIIGALFADWQSQFRENRQLKYFANYTDFKRAINNDVNNNKNENKYTILAMSVNDFETYKDLDYSLFKNDKNNVNILDNKSLFGIYMNNSSKQKYIPPIYCYNYKNKTTILNSDDNECDVIVKPNIGYGGIGTFVTKSTKINYELKNCITMKYIPHTVLYSGHFLVMNGNILKKIYFYTQVKASNGVIYKGRIINYDELSSLSIDDSIFDDIFKDLKYSGFACVDFTIVDSNIYIFEINPRIGGSLVFNKSQFDSFIDVLHKII